MPAEIRTSPSVIPLQKLPRIGRKALDVAALAFGINGVESERGLARTGQAGKHYQPVAGDFDIDISKIVLAGTFYRDVLLHFRQLRDQTISYDGFSPGPARVRPQDCRMSAQHLFVDIQATILID